MADNPFVIHRLVAAGFSPSEAKRLAKRKTTVEAKITEKDKERLLDWWYYNPAVPVRLKAILEAESTNA